MWALQACQYPSPGCSCKEAIGINWYWHSGPFFARPIGYNSVVAIYFLLLAAKQRINCIRKPFSSKLIVCNSCWVCTSYRQWYWWHVLQSLDLWHCMQSKIAGHLLHSTSLEQVLSRWARPGRYSRWWPHKVSVELAQECQREPHVASRKCRLFSQQWRTQTPTQIPRQTQTARKMVSRWGLCSPYKLQSLHYRDLLQSKKLARARARIDDMRIGALRRTQSGGLRISRSNMWSPPSQCWHGLYSIYEKEVITWVGSVRLTVSIIISYKALQPLPDHILMIT